MGDRWGHEGPPEEAYGRVSDPGRYAPLHPAARALLDGLAERYLVTREDTVDSGPSGNEPAPAVRLVPADPAASPLTVVFTAFPGLLLRMGLTDTQPIPDCGCDACDEAVEDCLDLLRERVEAVTAGTFGERLIRDGGWWHEHWFRSTEGQGSSRARIDRKKLRELRTLLPQGEQRWAPWPRQVPSRSHRPGSSR